MTKLLPPARSVTWNSQKILHMAKEYTIYGPNLIKFTSSCYCIEKQLINDRDSSCNQQCFIQGLHGSSASVIGKKLSRNSADLVDT
jgi:hypothetical protein